MQPAVTRRYLLAGLEGTPAVLYQLLNALTSDDERWDARPDLERFTLREVLAHLASSEPLWLSRVQRMRDEETPFFPTAPRQDDETASNAPMENLAIFRDTRLQYVAVLKELSGGQWERLGRSEFLGTVSIEQQALFVHSHDGYHLRQIAEWIA